MAVTNCFIEAEKFGPRIKAKIKVPEFKKRQ